MMSGLKLTWGSRPKSLAPASRMVTSVIRGMALLFAILVLSGATNAQTKVDALAAFGLLPPQNPQARLIQGTDGNFYGTTYAGGTSNAGTVFQLTPSGTLTILHTFQGGSNDGANPFSGLIQATDGNFYGTTYSGGASNAGTAFQLTPSGAFTNLYAFAGGSADGANPYGSLIQGSDGNFYGTTNLGGASNAGVVFQLTASGTLSVLHSFSGGTVDGAYPYAGLIQGSDANFYGTTSSGGTSNAGTLFQLSPAGAFQVLYSFTGAGADGANPYGGLIQGSDGNLYGTTNLGGASNAGAVFQVSPTGTFALLHAFTGATTDGGNPYGSLIQGIDGNFYGTTSLGGAYNEGTAFQITLAGGFTILHSFAGGTDGASPFSGLIQGIDGNFYGTTSIGGPANAGIVFQMNIAGTLTTLDALGAGAAEGAYPYGSLVQGTDGNFYATLSRGGASSAGTVIQVTPSGTLTVVHTFLGGSVEGSSPYGGLIQGSDGNFYGTTSQGGSSNLGTVFQLTPAGILTVLHSFSGGSADGSYPYAGLIQGTDGNFYGTTSQGGAANQGTAFQVTLAGGFTILHSFAGGATDGASPFSGLVQGIDGNFYGSTFSGGTSNEGTLFQLTPAGALSVLYSFAGGASDGANPRGGLIQGSDGNFYGTTTQGGAANSGVVFQLLPAGLVTILHSFAGGGTDGAFPYGGLIEGGDGNYYGTTTQGGVWNAGTVFQMTPAGMVSVMHEFSGGTDGDTPYSGVVRTADGSIYGTAYSGGSLGGGTIFALLTAPSPTVIWNAPAPIVYGTPLSGLQLNATANVSGTFTYTPAAGTVLGAGPQPISAVFTPSEGLNYANAVNTVTLTVTAATPVITWQPPATIPFGVALDGTVLNASANIPGTITYFPPAGTVLGSGAQTLSATFTPTDTTDYTTVTSSVTVNLVWMPPTSASGGGNEHPLQFTPRPGYRGLVVAGYGLVANSFGGFSVVGNCSYFTVQFGSGRGARTSVVNYDQTCTWDLYGNLLSVTPGAPAVPQPLAVNGTQTIYAANGTGVFTGTDSALRNGGFVYTPGSHYSWITPAPHLVLQQNIYTFTATLQSDGDSPLNISAVTATALRGSAIVTSTTCSGQLAVGSTCSVNVAYDPTSLFSPTGLAYDTLTIGVVSDAGQLQDFVQGYTIILSAQNSQENN